MDETTRIARQAWTAFHKGVRAAHLYSPDHHEAQRLVGEFVALVRSAAQGRGPLVLRFGPNGAEHCGAPLSGTKDPLAARLADDGIQSFSFSDAFDVAEGMLLLKLLEPFAVAERAPPQPLSECLRWETIGGLTVQMQLDGDSGGLAMDGLAAREHRWREDLGAAPDRSGPLGAAAFESIWDGTGGAIQWPPVPPKDVDDLCAEVDEVAATRAPLDRVGVLIASALRAWQDDPRASRILNPLPSLVRCLLARGRAGEVGVLLGPLLRWARADHDPSGADGARERVRALGDLLVDESCLASLLDLVRQGMAEPSDVAAWFAPLPLASLDGALSFLSMLPEGPHKEALSAVVVQAVGQRCVALREILLHGAPGAAQAAVETLTSLPMDRETVGLALEALSRTEPALLARIVDYLLPLRSRTIAERLVPLLSSERPEVRRGALTYMARYAYRPAFDALRDITTGGLFRQLPLLDRLEVCRTIGVVGGADAEALARSHLPTGWGRLDPDRSIPWIVCLAAAGSPSAADYLEAMAASPMETHRAIAREASALWKKRQDWRPAPPPVRTSPGAPIPQPLSDRRGPSTGVADQPREWSARHRAPAASGQWPILSESPPDPEDER